MRFWTRRTALLVTGFLENVLLTGTVVGWVSLNYMLKKEGVFYHLCDNEPTDNNSTTSSIFLSSTTESPPPNFYQKKFVWMVEQPVTFSESHVEIFSTKQKLATCPEQDRLLNLAFNISICVSAGMGIVLAFFFNRFGMRIARLLFSVLATGGYLMMTFTSKELPYLLYPALSLVATSTFALRITSLPIAELFPTQRSTIIAFYCGANSASAGVIILLKEIYDSGVDWTYTFLIMVGLSLPCLLVTFFLLPKTSFQKLIPKEKKEKNPKTISAFVTTEVSVEMSTDLKEVLPNKKTLDLPIIYSFFSLNSLLYNFWFSWMALYSFYYLGSLNLWVDRISHSLDDLSTYSNILGLTLLSALVIAPVGGIVMDISMRSSKKEYSLQKRCRRCFGALMLPTTALFGIQISKFFDNTTAIYVSIVCFTLLRSLMVGISTAFLRVRFPDQHFSRLIGMTGSVRGVCFLLQFPLFYWESISPQEAFHVTVTNLICLAFACLLPFHLLTPALGYLLRREEQAEARYRERQQIT